MHAMQALYQVNELHSQPLFHSAYFMANVHLSFCGCILIFPYPVYAQLLVDASVGGHRSAYISTFYPQSTRDGDPSLSGERATLVAGFNGGPGPQAGLC